MRAARQIISSDGGGHGQKDLRRTNSRGMSKISGIISLCVGLAALSCIGLQSISPHPSTVDGTAIRGVAISTKAFGSSNGNNAKDNANSITDNASTNNAVISAASNSADISLSLEISEELALAKKKYHVKKKKEVVLSKERFYFRRRRKWC